jgi:hypothetical protein
VRGILCILVSIGDASIFLIFGGAGRGWVWISGIPRFRGPARIVLGFLWAKKAQLIRLGFLGLLGDFSV